MDIGGFLAGLPALLGIVGFVAYQILQHFGRPNAIVSAIVEKLRLAAPERIPDQRLTASGVDQATPERRWAATPHFRTRLLFAEEGLESADRHISRCVPALRGIVHIWSAPICATASRYQNQ